MSDPKRGLRATLRRATFLTQDRHKKIQAAIDSLPAGTADNTLAQVIVSRNLMTRWQADQLLLGVFDLAIDHYELIDRIGEGGMSIVYKARDVTGRDQIFAVKVLSPTLLESEESLERFRRETKALSALRHPNIVSAVGGNSDGSRPYIVMEYVIGVNLGTYIQREGKLPIPLACEICRQIALGLNHAHEYGIAHRDMKPANVMITEAGKTNTLNAKILDMGLIAVLSAADGTRLTGLGQMIGTADYIAPEQAKNSREVTLRSDIFSLGVVLFELLTGGFPYPGDKRLDRLNAKMQSDPISLKSKMLDAPEALNELLARMLARKPEDRLQSAAQVAQVLLHFVHRR